MERFSVHKLEAYHMQIQVGRKKKKLKCTVILVQLQHMNKTELIFLLLLAQLKAVEPEARKLKPNLRIECFVELPPTKYI